MFREFAIFYCFVGFLFSSRPVCLHLNHLGAERLLVVRGARPLLLKEVNGERDFWTRSSASAKVLVAGLNQLAGCPVVPRRVLVEQRAELIQGAVHLLGGVWRATDATAICGLMQVAALVVVEKEDFTDIKCARRAETEPAGAPDGVALAAGVERVVDSLVCLGLLGGLDRTSLQDVHGEWNVFGGHKGLRVDGLGECLVGLKGLDELRGGRGLDGLHGMLADVDGLRGVGFFLEGRYPSIFLEPLRCHASVCSFYELVLIM